MQINPATLMCSVLAHLIEEVLINCVLSFTVLGVKWNEIEAIHELLQIEKQMKLQHSAPMLATGSSVRNQL